MKREKIQVNLEKTWLASRFERNSPIRGGAPGRSSRPRLTGSSLFHPRNDGSCWCKTSAGITYPLTRGLVLMLYLRTRNRPLSNSHNPFSLRLPRRSAPHLPGHPPKIERSSDDSDLGSGSVLYTLPGGSVTENRDASGRLGHDEVCG